MKRILFSFTLLFAQVFGQGDNSTQQDWPDQAGAQNVPTSNLIPSVTCVQKGDQAFGNYYIGDYYNDWGVLQRSEVWNETLQLRQIITCQNKTTRQIVGISGRTASVNATNTSNQFDVSVFDLRDAGNTDSTNPDIACTTMTLTQGEYIKTSGFVANDLGLQSIVFYTTGGQIYGTGSPGGQNDTVYVNFQEDEQLIGFFGTNRIGLNITSIGFLTYKEQCRKLNPSERALFITGNVFIFIGVLILLILLCCGVPICACMYVRKRRPDLMQKVVIPENIKKLARTKSQEDRGKIVPDSSMAADIEMTDNNIDDKSGIMTEDVKGAASKPAETEKPAQAKSLAAKGKGRK